MIAPSPERVRPQALTELLSHAIDYAGLYPPASLRMTDAVREYHAQRNGPHRWALGRFVVGANQLDAFAAARAALGGGGGGGGDSWPLAVLVAQSTDAIAASTDQLWHVEAIEAKAATPADVAALGPLKALASELYIEASLGNDLDSMIAAIKMLGARAKIRTGGVTLDAIPAAESVARFIVACVAAGVRFKATAGLHHLLRGEYALTYEPGSPRTTMFGYLNVFIAAALAYRGAPSATVTQALEEHDLSAFSLSPHSAELCWRDQCLTLADVRAGHARAIVAFGSCSFREPIDELLASGLAGRGVR